jgi:hypothetical protein
VCLLYDLDDKVIDEYDLHDKLLDLRKFYEADLWEFAQYINPTYAYGEVHEEVFNWFGKGDSLYQLLLLPRDHLKSHCAAVWVVWQITREPWSSIVYLSAGEDLAINQMYAIKNMMYSDEYKMLWPEMISQEKSKRDKDTAFALNVDHPERRKRRIRDNSLIIKTVKSNAIGLHCSHLVLDDVVVPKFAYTANGRLEVQQSVAQFASIKQPEAVTKAVGTRYHPEDLYQNFLEAQVPVMNDKGEILKHEQLWDVKQYELEDRGDGTGKYIWPKMYQPDNKKWFGFDIHVRARKLAEYESMGQEVQFRAQYYNEPNDPSMDRVARDKFVYYDQAFLRQEAGKWYYKDRLLNIQAGMDVAFTDLKASGGKRADYTAIAVVGIDQDGFIYILALDRFKTDDYDEYYKRVMALHEYWGFKKLRLETNTGGKLVKNALDKLIRQEGRILVVEPRPTTRSDGAKFERHAAVTEPLYKNQTIRHFKGGLTSMLEEEVRLLNPPTDDLKDAVYLGIEDLNPPSNRSVRNRPSDNVIIVPESRFGGRRIRRGNRRN